MKDNDQAPSDAEPSGSEILDFVMMALDENPQRLDLWMMRFEIVRSLALKDSFSDAMQRAYSDHRLRNGLDWHAIRRMWDELAPHDPPPDGVRLPDAEPVPGAASKPKYRRFSDIATELAGDALKALAAEYEELRRQPDFFKRFARATREHLNRPTSLQRAEELEKLFDFDGHILLKREDQLRNSPEREYAVAQAFVAKALGREKLICANEVDGFAFELARAANQFELELTVVLPPQQMGNNALTAELENRNAVLFSQDELGSEDSDNREAALRLWLQQSATAHLALSFGTGPHPYTRIVHDFQMLLGQETALQLRARKHRHKKQIAVASVQSEADSIGFVLPFLRNRDMELMLAEPGEKVGNKNGSIRWANYQGARREHNWLKATETITYIPISESHARRAQAQLEQVEGVVVSDQDARAIALALGLLEGGVTERDLVVLVA